MPLLYRHRHAPRLPGGKVYEEEGDEMMFCPPNCPNRALHCHSRCQRFLKARLMHELTARKAEQKESAAQAFREDVRARVLLKHMRLPKKYGTRD